MTDTMPAPADEPIELDEGPASEQAPVVEELLAQAVAVLEAARPMPLSTTSIIHKEEVIELIQQALAAMPAELRSARWLVRERDEYLARVELEGEEILAVARARAERMVERTEVVKSAEHRAQRLIADAEAEGRLMRRETEDFCDARLAALEGILDRTRAVVLTGRNRLQGVAAPPEPTSEAIELDTEPERALFDQDFS